MDDLLGPGQEHCFGDRSRPGGKEITFEHEILSFKLTARFHLAERRRTHAAQRLSGSLEHGAREV